MYLVTYTYFKSIKGGKHYSSIETIEGITKLIESEAIITLCVKLGDE